MTTDTHHPIYTTASGPDGVTGYDPGALDDWNVVKRVFIEEFPDRRIVRKAAAQLFPGKNFVTDEILGYVHTPNGIAEVSTGFMRPLIEHRVFGVTFADPGPDGKGGDSDRSRFCAEWGDVVDACNGR